jgi:hypothetical protein
MHATTLQIINVLFQRCRIFICRIIVRAWCSECVRLQSSIRESYELFWFFKPKEKKRKEKKRKEKRKHKKAQENKQKQKKTKEKKKM